MIEPSRTGAFALALVVLVAPVAGCGLDVTNPEVIAAEDFDPETDARTLSLSAQTNLYNAFGAAVVRGAMFSGETWVGAVRQETNDFGRRVITPANLDINPSLWSPLSLAVASNDQVLEVLEEVPDAGSDIHVARSAMNGAFALVLMAEHFCQGVIRVGPLLSPEATLDSAISRFEQALQAAADASEPEADKILEAARIGLARSHLQKGENGAAAAAAAEVSPGFEYLAVHADDPGNRGRVGNPVYDDTQGQIMVVAEAYRSLDDPRVPHQDQGTTAQDGQLPLVVQTKYPGYGAPIPIASGLEARYILAEAQLKQGDPTAAEQLIDERRAAGGQGAFGGGDDDAVLAELMDQRARDFWLEGKHMGDVRRNPSTTPYVPAAGTPFYKPSQGDFGDLTCIPVPNEERDANPQIP